MGVRIMLNRFLFLTLFMVLPSTFLCAQNQTGFINFEFNTDSAYVVSGNDLFSAIKLASGDSLEIETGVRLISLQTHFDKSPTLFIEVFKDSTVTYSYTFEKNNLGTSSITNNIAAREYYDANVIVLTDEDSEIFFEGNYKGTGFAKFNTLGEIGVLEIKNPDFGQTKRRLNAPGQKISVIESHLRPNKSTSVFYSIIPGVSQVYKKQYLKGLLLGTSAISLITLAAVKSSDYHDHLNLFYEYRDSYNNARNEQDAFYFGNLAESQQEKVQRLDNQRRGFLLAGILIYGYNIYDAFTSKPKGGFMNKEKGLRFYLSQEKFSGYLSPFGTLSLSF